MGFKKKTTAEYKGSCLKPSCQQLPSFHSSNYRNRPKKQEIVFSADAAASWGGHDGDWPAISRGAYVS